MALRSPLRGVLTAHLQASYNRLTRQLGARGTLALVVGLGLLTVTAVMPVVLGLSLGAFFLAKQAFGVNGAPELGNVIGLVVTAISIGGGLVGGAGGGAKQLAREQYRGYPLGTWTLFAAELLTGLGDAITLVEAVTLIGICLATGLAAPHLAPGLLVLAIEAVGVLLCVQLVVGGLAERLVKRLKLALAASLGLAWVVGQLSSRAAVSSSAVDVVGVREVGQRVLDLAGLLPASQTLRAAHTGHWMGMASGGLLLALLLVGAFVLVWRERDSALLDAAGPRQKLWSYARPVVSLARLQLDTLLGSGPGKFAFAMPLLTLVIVKGPLAQLLGRGEWVVPAAFIYLALAANGLGFNQFGLDGHGVKALFLLPIGDQTILEGKQLGFAVWQAMQAVLLAALLLLLQSARLDEVLAGVLLFACYFFAQGVVGQRTSVWLPRRMAHNSMKNTQVALPVAMIALATTLGCGLVFGGAFWGLAVFARPLLLPGMAALAAAAFAVSRPALRLNAEFLTRHRERVVDAVG